MKRYSKGEMREVILSALLVSGVIATTLVAPNAVQLFKYFGPKTKADRSGIRRSVARMEKQGLIARKKSGVIVLTRTGKRIAMRSQLKNMRIAPQQKWDGLWRIIMFDIPEEKKLARRALGFRLKELGCASYQKSVFVTPYPCVKEIDFVGECFNVRSYIRIITAQDVERVYALKRHFGLK